jgi:hypothetical protein
MGTRSVRQPPSCPERGDIARGAALRLGATPLESLVVGQVAAYGALCWLKDHELAEDLVQRNGRHPHPRSVARSRRNAAAAGLLQCQRLFSGQKCPGMRGTVSYGTTAKIVIFNKDFGRDPLRRGQARKMRLRQMAVEAEYAPPVKGTPNEGVPKHSVPPQPYETTTSTGDSELDRLIAETGAALGRRDDARHAAEDRRMMDSVHALRRAERSRGPPRK